MLLPKRIVRNTQMTNYRREERRGAKRGEEGSSTEGKGAYIIHMGSIQIHLKGVNHLHRRSREPDLCHEVCDGAISVSGTIGQVT